MADEEMADEEMADEEMADEEQQKDNQHSLVSVQQEHHEMKVQAEGSSLDIISSLPTTIIDTILCLLPIKDAVRTSKLSRDWRYNWVTIPKLVFDWGDMLGKTSHGILDAIHQVLLLHRGPILEFELSMRNVENKSNAIDQIISHLVRNNNTLKKFTLDLMESGFHTDFPLYEFPLSIFSLHQLTDLYVKNCTFDYNPTISGFRSLTSLYLETNNMINLSKKALLHFFSHCPLLKRLELVLGDEGIDEAITIMDIPKCLPVIEHLSFYRWTVESSAQNSVGRKLPMALVHLKYFCLNMMKLFDDDGLRFLGLVMRNSPNLEKIKLDIVDDGFDEDDIKLDTLKHCGDIWFEHLKELEIVDFSNAEGEMEFVELILAKSPVLENVIIVAHKYDVTEDEKLEISKTLLQSKRASPSANIIVERCSLCY
ncbi:F-box/FBD/LRR-repeat protein [Tanacetum coccineum]|uniref:F-box/FBD/LRR-repeat protein n=1 Tax=Tanacetum coccineum TaxID=301880 RepID=A0ABQ5D620_9ASTR